MPPSGRAKKPMPNVATDSSRLTFGLEAGKKLRPITAANAGLPTTAIATANFETFAHEIAERGGRSGLRVHVLPYPLNEQLKEDVLPIGEAHFDGVLRTMGATLTAREKAV